VTFEKKPLSKDAVAHALQKAERYRLLNEPTDAESICRDVLHADPGNTEARVMLLLALTDQFGSGSGNDLAAARGVLGELTDPYQRAYYGGIICERWGKALFARHAPGSGEAVHHWLTEAMKLYAAAEPLRRPGDDGPILRWNACARMLERHPELLKPRQAGVEGPITSE
jgi:hypothetical protein